MQISGSLFQAIAFASCMIIAAATLYSASAQLVTLSIYRPGDSSCSNPYGPPYPFQSSLESGGCSNNVPLPWGGQGGDASWSVNLNNETNSYIISLWSETNCSGSDLQLGGQGAECVIEGMDEPWIVSSPIIAPCTFSYFSDSSCTQLVTEYGMVPNVCNKDNTLAQWISLTVNEVDQSYTIQGWPGISQCSGESTLNLQGNLQTCINNGTLNCNSNYNKHIALQ